MAVGADAGLTTTLNEDCAELVASSVAVQVTAVVPIANELPDAGTQAIVTLASTASVAVGFENVTVAEDPPAIAVTSACDAREGAVVSETVTLNPPLVVFMAESVAEQDTAVVPIINVLPDAGAHDTDTEPSTASLALAVNATAAPEAPVASAETLTGRTRTGPSVSSTITLNDEVPVLPFASVAEQDTAVVPIVNVLPDAGAHDTDTEPSTASVAVGEEYETLAPLPLDASAVTFDGEESVGAVVSETTMLKFVCVAAFPAASAAEHVTAVVPIVNALPDAGAHDAVPAPSTASDVLGETYVTIAPLADVASAVEVACVAITGAIVS